MTVDGADIEVLDSTPALVDDHRAETRVVRTDPTYRIQDAAVRFRAWARREPSVVALAVMVLVWFVVFAKLVWGRHHHFATFDFDLGHHDQAIWLLAHGRGFDTVSGMPVLGHHFTVAYFLLAPFYWLGAGPQFIDMLQTAAIAATAIPVYVYARQRLRGPWLGTAMAAVWLLNPSVQWITWETWHPETVAIPFLLGAYVLAMRRSWRWYWPVLLLALMWKEDLALAAMVIGVVLFVRGSRRVGLVTFGVAAAWFALAYGIVLPHFNGGTNHAGTFYGDLGSGPTDVVRTALTNPTRIAHRLDANNGLGYARDVLLAFGLTPLLAPLLVLAAVPQFFANSLATLNFFYDIRFHYVAIVVVMLMLASIEGIARFRQAGIRQFAVGVTTACALATSVAWGISPISTQFRSGYWPLDGNARQEAYDAAVAEVPGGESVSAGYHFVPHLSHREQIYTYPNPWIPANWGVGGVAPHDPRHDHVPAEVDWIVVDRTLLQPESRELNLLTTLIDDGEFHVVSEDDGVVVAQRVTPPVGTIGPDGLPVGDGG